MNQKKAKQSRKNKGIGFISPPYQNGRKEIQIPQAQKKVVLPTYLRASKKG